MEHTLGKRIAAHRKRLGMTQDQLAEKLGVSAQAVSKWENDQSCPDITTLPRLAGIFGTTTDALLGAEPEPVVHQATVVDSVPAEEGDNVEITYNFSRNNSLCFAIIVIAVGLLFLLSNVMTMNVSLWELAWPTALLIFGLFGLYPKFSFFRLGCAVIGSYFLLVHLYIIPELDSGLLISVIIVLFGISLLIDALRKSRQKKSGFVYTHNGKKGEPQQDYKETGDHFRFSASFGDSTRQIGIPHLSGGQIDVNFGDYTVDLSRVLTVSENCTISASTSFGDLTILVPSRFQVQCNGSGAFSSLDTEGSHDAVPAGVIHLNANTSFGELTVTYV